MDGHELQTFRDKMKITIEEEKKLDIPEDRWGLWNIVGQNTSTDVRHAYPLYLPSIRDGHGDSPRRRKQDSLNSVSSYSLVQPIQLPTSTPAALVNLRSSHSLHNTVTTDIFL